MVDKLPSHGPRSHYLRNFDLYLESANEPIFFIGKGQLAFDVL